MKKSVLLLLTLICYLSVVSQDKLQRNEHRNITDTEILPDHDGSVWGYLVDLHTTKIYELKDDKLYIGRSTNSVKNDISFSDRYISRRHIMINKKSMLKDLGSTNGTGVNAQPLEPSKGIQLNDGDIVVLAGIKALQFFKSNPIVSEIPDGTWGIFVDGRSRRYTYLSENEYGWKISGEHLVLLKNITEEVQLKVRWDESLIELYDTEDDPELYFQVKETEEGYDTYMYDSGYWDEFSGNSFWYFEYTEESNKEKGKSPVFQIIEF
jgi:pSer/pThr/pTyr-binding forkhead associated (FHA) protein